MTVNYTIRPVDGDDEANYETLCELHDEIFVDTAPLVDFAKGQWWLALSGAEPVGFVGITPASYMPHTGYLSRVGVVGRHRGQGLQRRLMRACDRHAKREGWGTIYTDCASFNVQSANNLFRAGYALFRPDPLWCGEEWLYWRKRLDV
mgnify:CR=1 FL=1